MSGIATLAPPDNPELAPKTNKPSYEYEREWRQWRTKTASEKGIDPKTAVDGPQSKEHVLSPAERQRRLHRVLSDRQGFMKRVGQGMVGPIQIKLRYQGMLRNVLLEDPLTPGVPIEYDILDDQGAAQMLSGNDGEVAVTLFEGKRAPVRLFRLASYPSIKVEDLYLMRVNIVEYVQDLTKQAIMILEDARLLTLLEAALQAWGTSAYHDVSTGAHITDELSGYLSPDSFYDAVSLTDVHQIESARILAHPVEYRDIFRWDLNSTGFAFKDAIVSGQKVVSFGEFQIQRSIAVPQGSLYLTPAPEFLGVFPTMYTLNVEENHTPPRFRKGWVMDELVGMAVLNPRGLAKIQKP